MAVTKIWCIKNGVYDVLRYTANQLKTENTNFEVAAAYHQIGQVLHYTADEMKTEKQLFVSGVNCDSDPLLAGKQFMRTKDHYRKTGGIMCFHAIQSFRCGEGTPEVAHKVGIELAKRMWGDRFEVVVSTHLNTGSLHNHFVINSVSFADGLRYYDQKATYAKVRETSDQICREYGLSVIENPQRDQSRPLWEIKAEEEGRITVRDQIRRDIDLAISQRDSWTYFQPTLESLGYSLEYRGKYLRIRPDQSKKWFRMEKLGEGYTVADIKERLRQNYLKNRSRYFHPFTPQTRQKPKGLYALYLHYQYLLGNLPKTKPASHEVYAYMKEDAKRMERYSNEAKLLGQYHIDTAEQLHDFTEHIGNRFKALAIQRKKLRNKLRHMTDSERMQPIKEQITGLSLQMNELRRQMRLCESIAERSGAVEAIVNIIYEPERAKELTEKQKSKGAKTRE